MFNSLHGHSMYSLLDGLSSIETLVTRYKELGYESVALTDHRTISGCVKFYKECKKQDIRPILGCEFDVTEGKSTEKNKDNKTGHLVVLAKNLAGWRGLINLVSRSNDSENFYYRPRVDLDMIREFSGDLISFSGHPGSTLSNAIFSDSAVYRCKTKEEVYEYFRPDMEGRLKTEIDRHIKCFGRENFFLEIQLFDENMIVQSVLADIFRDFGQKLNIPRVATLDVHYSEQKDAEDQRLILCSSVGKTFSQARELMATNDFGFEGFFKSDKYYIHTQEEVESIYNHDEIDNTKVIADMVEDYDILKSPILPKFTDDEFEHLEKLCNEGWSKLDYIEDEAEYKERLQEELDVIKEAGLAGYFLIVQDYCNWYRDNGGLLGPARGSAAGSLVAFLIGITTVDPIKYGLIFSRFYNIARKGSLPDIDCDFQTDKREMVINYLKDKYGENRVTQMATFGRIMGRGALKEVLRIHGACSPTEINKITENIPDESKIADELKDMDERSIVLWSLINSPEKFTQWCSYKDGKFYGQYAQYFEQAVRLEGTFKSQGKHAAGVIISNEDLNTICPMVRDTGGAKVAGLEMNDLEAIGQVKFDILGLAALNRLAETNNIIFEVKNEHIM